MNGVTCIELCFGRWLGVQVAVTGSGMAVCDYAKEVLKRVTLKDGKLAVLEIGALVCKPLGEFP